MELIHEEDRPLVEVAMERVLQDAEPVEIEFRIVVGDEIRQIWGVGRCPAEGDGPAHAAARRGRDLVRQLMTFSRDRHLSLEETDMSRLLGDMSGLVRRALPESVEVSVDAPETPLVARVDSGVVQPIVLNLVNNARQAMDAGGRFALVVDRVDAGSEDPELEPGDYVRVRARDTGSGMTPEVVARAFEPFFTT